MGGISRATRKRFDSCAVTQIGILELYAYVILARNETLPVGRMVILESRAKTGSFFSKIQVTMIQTQSSGLEGASKEQRRSPTRVP